MIEQLANHIVDYDPAAVLRRTQDTVRYIQAEWRKSHAESIDEDAVRLFLCDEHCGDLTEEQKALARRCRDEMRNVYGAAVLRLLLCEEMLRRNIVQDFQAYRRVFGSEDGDMPGGIIAVWDCLSPPKTKQEKGEALLARLSAPQMPAVRAFSRVSDRGHWNVPLRGCGTYLTLQIEKSQCLQGFAPTLHRNLSAILTDFGQIKPEIRCKNLLKSNSYFTQSVVVVCVTKIETEEVFRNGKTKTCR